MNIILFCTAIRNVYMYKCIYTFVYNHTQIYIKPDMKVKILRKARRLNMSVSQLMILGALSYERPAEKGGVGNDL